MKTYCDFCNGGKQLPNTKSGKRYYINASMNEIQADDDNVSVERIPIDFCPICGIRLSPIRATDETNKKMDNWLRNRFDL